MANSVSILYKGMECLMENLGLVDAERFITLIGSDGFDYTEWRKDHLLPGASVEEISGAAMQDRNELRV